MSGLGLLFFMVLPLAAAGLTALALIDIARRNTDLWSASGYSQLSWMAVVVLVPLAGALVYFHEIRPVLSEITHVRPGFGHSGS